MSGLIRWANFDFLRQVEVVVGLRMTRIVAK
jgi:hypothetical protein